MGDIVNNYEVMTTAYERRVEGIAILCDIVQKLRDGGHTLTADRLVATLNSAPRGTMRGWMESHSGRYVTTIQVDNSNRSVWAPVGRWITAHGTHVTLAGSRRDYAGMRVVATGDWGLIVQDDWHTIAYVLEA
jgi:hypothetical protein